MLFLSFDFFYECAVSLIRKGLAYVDEQTVEEIRAQRGNVNVPCLLYTSRCV